MKRVVITGANRGIGLALVEAVLEASEENAVWLGARDEARGTTACESLCKKNAAWADRLTVLPLDVADANSVKAAAATVGATLASGGAI